MNLYHFIFMSTFTHVATILSELFLSLHVAVCTLIPRSLNRIARGPLTNTKAIRF